MRNKRGVLVILSFLFLVVLNGCNLPGGTEKREVISYQIENQLETLDPAHGRGAQEQGVMANLFEGLTLTNEKGEITPGTAKEWKISEDGKEITFLLRENLTFSDGTPIEGKDIYYSIIRGINPATQGKNVEQFYPLKNGKKASKGEVPLEQVGAVVENPTQIKLIFEEALPTNLMAVSAMGYAPLKAEMVENQPDWWKNPATFICNGSFSLSAVEEGKYTLMRNEHYRETPKEGIKGVTYQVQKEEKRLLEENEQQSYDILTSHLDKIPNRKDITLKQVNLPGTFWLGLNTNKEKAGEEVGNFLGNPQVRESLNLAIDREKIATEVLKNENSLGWRMVPSQISVSGENETTPLNQREEKAKSLLAEGGYPGGENGPALELFYGGDDLTEKVLTVIANSWTEVLGLNITLKRESDLGKYAQDRVEGNFQITRGETFGLPHPYEFLKNFRSNYVLNYGKYTQGAFDEKLIIPEGAYQEEEVDKRLKEAEDLLLQEHWIMPIFYYVQNYIVPKDLQGITYTKEGQPVFTQAKWE